MTSSLPTASRVALVCTLASALLTASAHAQSSEAAAPASADAPVAQAAPAAPALEPQAPAKPDAEAKQDPAALVLGAPTPATRPLFALGSDTYFISPVLSIAGGLQSENLLVNPNPEKESRITTVALARFGAEGRLGPYVTFRSEFERNIRSHGSGIWEGTASMSVRDQVLRLQRWGATVEAGIILDPASVDYFSAHMGDVLLADKYTRDPLLYSGFNRGQGVQARYSRWGLTAGLSYTEANPLSTSASFMVGGSFGGNSRFWERPLGNFRNGQPDDDIHFRVISPSISYEHPWFEAKAMAQVFSINYQATSTQDPPLDGYNLRGGVKLKLKGMVPALPVEVTPFFNVARVQNDVVNSVAGYSNQLLQTPFDALTLSGGLDVFLFGRSGVGFNFVRVADHTPSFVPRTGDTPASEPVTNTALTYFNVGATWWMFDQVALGARVATYARNIEGKPELKERDLSGFLTLRMIL
ncbi:hypothetical protein ATI61_111274 [Archangium gephyra]|uniref:Uncharacterized protein n=1 Tax=Archangium gephyra TaxID=48 RepID=A0AAC8QH16_9BACT|nr:hypothetical protein [Archangium gephyra]AKJ07319.1 Hypothetical protein AA314_08945 [Archangium gephyra]REG26723.1 hypothetical protein ATI61_111274 [Archangium gephyra]